MDGHFVTIRQTMTLPERRPAGHSFLCDFIDEVKASGFVGAGLARSGQPDATVAGPSFRP